MSYIQQINWDKPLQEKKKKKYAEHYFISF